VPVKSQRQKSSLPKNKYQESPPPLCQSKVNVKSQRQRQKKIPFHIAAEEDIPKTDYVFMSVLNKRTPSGASKGHFSKYKTWKTGGQHCS
jgi:hypothetical protein